MSFFKKLSIKSILTGMLLLSLSTYGLAADFKTLETKIGNADNQIYGLTYLPEKQGKMPLVIFSHELTVTHKTMQPYAEKLAKQGIASYVFDFRGGGVESKSAGKTTDMSVMTEVRDLEEVLAAAQKWDFVDPNKIILIGGSQGGMVSALTASRNASKVAGLVLLYPAFVIEDDVHSFFPNKQDIPTEFNYRGWIKVGKNYFADLYDINVMNEIGKYQKPVLILHGDLDPQVPVTKSKTAQSHYPNAELKIIKGAEHSFLKEPYFTQALQEINQYLKANGLDK
ncbi:alpha/beta fold hydrolase [Bisgaard Taxon 10/6]|uniref:alpha/beta hydrolase family protein n=1 Tax=Exercitatus varius TaxID=67857 RepID=UPI00294AA39A|nr:alpha/beta fold hydrolase [Exercitatus varius]MDG2954813.1 alpha/beta fold hydrolase [Exercitatus varius]